MGGMQGLSITSQQNLEEILNHQRALAMKHGMVPHGLLPVSPSGLFHPSTMPPYPPQPFHLNPLLGYELMYQQAAHHMQLLAASQQQQQQTTVSQSQSQLQLC